MQEIIDYERVIVVKDGRVILVRRAVYRNLGRGSTDTKYRSRELTELLNQPYGKKIA